MQWNNVRLLTKVRERLNRVWVAYEAYDQSKNQPFVIVVAAAADAVNAAAD